MSGRVLVDSSAWIEFFRDTGSEVSAIVRQLLEHDLVARTGIIQAELIQGTRTTTEKHQLELLFEALPNLTEPPRAWEEVGELGFSLRRAGISGVGIADLLIAVTAHHNHVHLLSLDRHFPKIATILPLQLLPDSKLA